MISKAVEKIYRKMVYNRADDNGCVVYFTHKDFPGLHSQEYIFSSSLGHKLAGAFYYYDGYDRDRLIIFDHGMGSGHTGYMTEIERLCRAGYRIFSYDHTGCMSSGGESTNGFTQSLRDLDDAVKAIKKDEGCSGLRLSVMGHSWGAFSTLNITALHPDIEKIVTMSGFISVENVLKGFFSGPLAPFYKKILAIEKSSNPDYFSFSALETLKNTPAEALIIHSDDDKTVSAKLSFDILEKELSDRSNLRF
ncbi:MAG: alpha/beta fold hydrolase, partial [Clostridia bacterium]|nr:alpha/beta fold hydrolase [Clostridia bacterium]